MTKNRIKNMEPRKERYSIRKLSVGAASVLIGLTFISMGNSHSVSAATTNSEAVASETTSETAQTKQNNPASPATPTLTAKSTSKAATKMVNEEKLPTKPYQANNITSPSTQKQTLTIPKKSSQMAPLSKAAISEQKTQETTIKNVDLSGTLSEMNSNINLKQGTTFNISGNFSNSGFEINSVTDNQGNHVNYSDKDGKLALDFSKSINLMYNSNQNNPYQVPTFKDLDIDLSNLKPADLTTKNNITTLNDNYDLASKCTYNGTSTITPTYQSVGRIISVDENNNQLLYPFTRVYNASNVNNDTGNFKTILSADEIGNLNTPLTVTLPKISGYSAVNDAGTPISSITVNNILKNTVVNYRKNDSAEAGNLNIYPITDMSTTTPSVMTPVESISLNQSTIINFDPAFITNLNKKLPLDDQNARYNIIIDQTGKRISSIDLNTISDKSKDINLFLVRNAIDPQTIQVSAGKSKGIDINSENNYELFNENGKFVAYNVKDTLADSDQKHVVDDIDMSISNGSEVLYPMGITSIPNSGDANFTNMMGTLNPNTGKYDPVTIQAYSQDGRRVIGNWQLQLGDSTYDGGYKNIIHVTFTSTDKTYQGPVQPIYIEGSSDGGPNPMVATVNATVSLQDASVKFIDENQSNPQNLNSYNETAQGAVDDQISFKIPVEDQIKKLEDLGYSLISDNFDNGNKYYNEDNTKNQFVVYVNHKLGITPENVSVKRTINYQGILPNGKIIAVNGSPQGNSTDTQTANFTRNAVVDKVSNQILGYDTNSDLDLPEVTVKDGDQAWISMTPILPEVDSQAPDKVKGPDGKAFTSVDVPVVSTVTVSPNSKDITVLVTYKREIGKANLLIVDEDNAMKQIELPGIQTSFDSEGNVGTPINFDGTDTSVTNLEKDGYVYDSTNFKAGTKFDNLNDDKGDSQQYLIVMKHGQVPATPENPHNVDPNELTKHYISTVYYQTHDGKTVAPTSSQTSTWTRHLTVDAINEDIIKNGIYDTPWTPNKSYYDKFNLPSVTDYTVESVTKNGIHITTFVPGQKVIQQNLADTVYYDPIPVIEQGSIRVIVHDVQTNQDLSDYGKYSNVENVGTRFAYNTAAVISELTKAGYRVLNPQIVIPAEISKGDHQFVIYVDHQVIPVTPKHPGNGLTADNLQRSVTETVNYLVDGNQSLAPNAHLATLNFTGKAYYDSVTKKWTNASGKELANQTENITWTASDGSSFNIVVSPIINGYHVISVSGNYNDGNGNVKAISGINQNSKDIVVTVTYAKTPIVPVKSLQKAQLIIRDVTPGQEKELGTFTQSGYKGDAINFKDASELVQDLLGENYAWDSANYNDKVLNAKDYSQIIFGKYDNLSDKNKISQKWIINLIHMAAPVSLKNTITRDVTYVNEQGSEMDGLNPVQQKAEFQGNGYRDQVTGKWVTVANGKITGLAQGLTWIPDKGIFNAIPAKKADGYHVVYVSSNGVLGFNVSSNGAISEQNVTYSTPSSTIKVVYAPNTKTPTATTGSITYVDDTTGKILERANFGGEVGSKINYDTAKTIAYYEGKGYSLVSNNFNDGQEIYQKDPKDNIFEVHFTHKLNSHNLKNTITRDIDYVYDDGSQAEVPIHQEFTFTGKTATDEVTGSKKTKWDASMHDFDATKSIDTSKYKIINVREINTSAKVNMNNGTVAAQPITPTSQDSTIIITLVKTPAPVKNGTVIINYIDKTNGKLLETKTLTGRKGDKVNYNPTSIIEKYTNAGYQLEKDDYPTQTILYPEGTRTYEIDFVHSTTTKTFTKVGTQTVHYEGADDQTPKDNVSTIKFEDSVTYDNVTKQAVKDTGWGSSQTYKTIISPIIKGYTADKSQVGGETIAGEKNDDIDRNYLVVYTKNPTPTPQPNNHQPTTPSLTPQQNPQEPQTPNAPTQKPKVNEPNTIPQKYDTTSQRPTPSKKLISKKSVEKLSNEPVNHKKYSVDHKTPTITENKRLISAKLKRVNANKLEFSHLVKKIKSDTTPTIQSKSIEEKAPNIAPTASKMIANKKVKHQRKLPQTGTVNDTLAGNLGLAILVTSSIILSSLFGASRKRRK